MIDRGRNETRRRRRYPAAALLLLLLPACGAGQRAPSATPPPSPTPITTSPPDGLPSRATAVSFRASDGVELLGTVVGHGTTAIVLAHMGRPGDSQQDWFTMASRFDPDRYAVLTFNRRGVCSPEGDECSEGADTLGESWKDVLGAVRYVRDRGARRVFVGGASIGAMASLYVAERPDMALAGVIWVAGIESGSGYQFTKSDVRAINAPKLFVSGDGDIFFADESTRSLFRWARQPKRLAILDSDEHGTDMFDTPVGRELERLILEFVERYS